MSTAAPMATPLKQAAVLRFSDKTVLALFANSKAVSKNFVSETIAKQQGAKPIVPGKKYTTQGADVALHYTLDPHGRIYAIVSSAEFSPRIVFMALDELKVTFAKDFGPKCSSATENSLSKAAGPLLSGILQK